MISLVFQNGIKPTGWQTRRQKQGDNHSMQSTRTGMRIRPPGERICQLALSLWLILLLSSPGICLAFSGKSLPAAVRGLLKNQDAALLAGPDGRLMFSWNERKPLVPASILKLLTALAVFDQLGTDYRFPTNFFLNAENDLVIKGYGDPLLISEVVDQAAWQLSRKARRVSDLLADGTYFSRRLRIPGTGLSAQPYDAPSGALCVNFNTVNFKTANGRLISAEPQTPLLPLAVAKIRRQKLTEGRITFSSDSRDALVYAGQMFAFFLARHGVQIEGDIKPLKKACQTCRRLMTFQSPFTLRQVVARLMTYSNNFIANQILLAAAADAFGPPADLSKAVRLLNRYAVKTCGLHDVRLAEGSGISRRNRISALGMLKVLELFRPHYRLLRYDPAKDRFYKTGTLKGIRTRAGFIQDRSKRLYPYVIMGRAPAQVAGIETFLAGMVKRR